MSYQCNEMITYHILLKHFQVDGDRKITAVEMQQQLMDETKLQRAKADQPKFTRTDAR